jgi:hypothetical protein
MTQKKQKQKSFTSNQRSLELAHDLDDRLILAIDPGMITGICIMETNGKVLEIDNLPLEEVYEILDKDMAQRIQLVIMEEYIVGNRAPYLKGSRNEASQVIGVVNAWARIYGIPIVMQMPGIKTIAERLSGKRPRGPHKENHWVDAFNHGYYWLHSVGLVRREW